MSKKPNASVHKTSRKGGGKPSKRAGYSAGDFGRIAGTEGLQLNREQRRAKERLERRGKLADNG